MFGGKKLLFPIPTIDKAVVIFIKDRVEKGEYKPVIDSYYKLDQIIEAYKQVETWQKTGNVVLKIVDLLFEVKFNKKNKLLVIGGGITQDVGGFIAAIYKRGLKWILVPTTLLSMTDSCIGGKVCINRVSKNMLGLFCAPNKVIVSDYFIKSLKHDDIISGVGEALKLSLIGGNNTYVNFLENYNETKIDYIRLLKLRII